MGSQGPIVMQMQLKLRDLGYPLKGTGYFGNATHTALRAFQKKIGIDPDGVLGPKTAEQLNKLKAFTDTKPIRAETARPLWLVAGLALIGTKEKAGPGNNPVIIDWAKDEGGSVAKSYTHDSIPWCALFANHMLSEVGLPGTETLWALDFAGKWPATNLGEPAVGAFAPMLRNGGGHIAVVVGRDRYGNVMGLGGNQNDAVNITAFARSRLNKGFWWPKSVPKPTVLGFDKLPLVASDGKVSSNER